MRILENNQAIAEQVVAVRERWRQHVDQSYPERDVRRPKPENQPWPWFDRVGDGERAKDAEHFAKLVGAGLAGVVAGAAATSASWNVRGQVIGELGAARFDMGCLVQTVAGFEQVAKGLFGYKEKYRRRNAVADCLPEGRTPWPNLANFELRELIILKKDYADMAEIGEITRDGDFAIAWMRRAAKIPDNAPTAKRDRIRVAHGLRHLIAHGVLSPTKVQKLGLTAWLNWAIGDLAIAAAAAAENALRR